VQCKLLLVLGKLAAQNICGTYLSYACCWLALNTASMLGTHITRGAIMIDLAQAKSPQPESSPVSFRQVNAGHEPGADVGPLISVAAKERVQRLIQSAVDEVTSYFTAG